MKLQYIVVVSRPWMNKSGHGWHHRSDMMRFDDREESFAHGFKTVGSDDFNIGTVRGNALVAVGWMWDDFDPEDGGLVEIAPALGLIAREER